MTTTHRYTKLRKSILRSKATQRNLLVPPKATNEEVIRLLEQNDTVCKYYPGAQIGDILQLKLNTHGKTRGLVGLLHCPLPL